MTVKTLELLAQTSLYNPKIQRRVDEHPYPELMMSAFKLLSENELLNRENLDAISLHPKPNQLAKALILLKEHKMLSSTHLEMISQIPEAETAIYIWLILDKTKLLSEENKKIISGHASIPNLFSGLSTLSAHFILNESTLEHLLTHPHPNELALAYIKLKLIGIFSPEIQHHVATQTHPQLLTLLINILHQTHIFTPYHFTLLDNHPQICLIYYVCNQLERAAVVIHQQLFDLILQHANQLELVVEILSVISKNKIKIPNYFYFLENILEQDNIEELVSVMMALDKFKMLTQDNFLKITDFNPDLKTTLYLEILCLDKCLILNQENFDFLHQNVAPHLASALAYLKSSSILNDEYRDIIKTAAHSRLVYSNLYYLEANDVLIKAHHLISESSWSQFDIATTLKTLHNSRQLNLANLISLILPMRDSSSSDLIKAQLTLFQNSILSPELLSFIKESSNPYDVAVILCLLHQNELLNPENIAKLNQSRTKEDFYFCQKTLAYVNQASILTQANFDLIMQSQNLRFLKIASEHLWKLSYLNQEHFNIISRVNEIGNNLLEIFNILGFAKKLNRLTMMALMNPQHQALLSQKTISHFWYKIPAHQLSDDNLHQIFVASTQAKPLLAIQQLKLIPSLISSPLKSSQISSIQALNSRYRDILTQVKQQILKINAWMYQRPDTAKLQAAKRLIHRYSPLIDSQNPTPRLLVLVYHALHDPSKCKLNEKEAGNFFIELLYENQRAFNINEEGIDRGGEDLALSANGSFQKILEKLNGIHPDIVLEYPSPALIAQKQALIYLQSLAFPLTAADYQSTKILIAKLEDSKTLEPIWGRLLSEFRTEFHALDGKSIPCPNLDKLERALQISPGYRAYVASQQAQSDISHFSLFLGQEPSRLESSRPFKKTYSGK